MTGVGVGYMQYGQNLTKNNYTVRVADATVIDMVAADEEVHCIVYSAEGSEITRFNCAYKEVHRILHEQSYPQGVYVLRMKTSQIEWGEKYVVR